MTEAFENEANNDVMGERDDQAPAFDPFELDETPATGLPDIKELVGHLVVMRPLFWTKEHDRGGEEFRALRVEVLDLEDPTGELIHYDDVMVTWKQVVFQLVGKGNDPDHMPDGQATRWRAGTVIEEKQGRNRMMRYQLPNDAQKKRVREAGAAFQRGEVRRVTRPTYEGPTT